MRGVLERSPEPSLELLNAPQQQGRAPMLLQSRSPRAQSCSSCHFLHSPTAARKGCSALFWYRWLKILGQPSPHSDSSDEITIKQRLPFGSLSSSPCITQRGWKELLSSYSGPFNLKNWTKMKYIQKIRLNCPCYQLVNWPWGEHVAFLKPGFLTYKMRMKNYLSIVFLTGSYQGPRKYFQKQPSAMVWKQACLDWILILLLFAVWPWVSHLTFLSFSVIIHNWKYKDCLPMVARVFVSIKLEKFVYKLFMMPSTW